MGKNFREYDAVIDALDLSVRLLDPASAAGAHDLADVGLSASALGQLRSARSTTAAAELAALLEVAISALGKAAELARVLGAAADQPQFAPTPDISGPGPDDERRTGQRPPHARQFAVLPQILEHSIRRRAGGLSPAALRLLYSLLELPDVFIGNNDLLRKSGIGSANKRTVRVYISRIRTALAELGIEDAIATGNGSYALRSGHVKAILGFMENG